MKTAIDFYERGKEKESNAEDYNHLLRFPADRFICPACGERVFLTRGKYTNHFSHYKKNDEYDDCDRRVDGISTESIYERIGLPLYISRETEQGFSLYVSFRALKQRLLDLLNKTSVTMHVGKYSKFNVTGERFSSDKSTWIPIKEAKTIQESIPISFQGNADIVKELDNYWGCYAEGFSFYGAVFTVVSDHGRKLHSGDSITTGTDYFWVTSSKKLISNISGVNVDYEGRLLLDTLNYQIYRIHISTNLNDKEFRSVSNIFLSFFKLHLLEKTPIAIPIWPPLIKSGEGYITDSSVNSVFAHVESGNSTPKVYCYRGLGKTAEQLSVDSNNLISIPMIDSQMLINIDIKYVSNGLFLIKSKRNSNEVSKEKHIFLTEGINTYGVVYITDKKDLSINLSEKSEIVHIRNKQIDFYGNRTEINIGKIAPGDRLLVFFSSVLVGIITCQAKREYERNEWCLELETLYVKHKHSTKLIIPYAIRQLLESVSDNNSIAKQILVEKKISAPLITYLEGII